jgi:hypothetical protein
VGSALVNQLISHETHLACRFRRRVPGKGAQDPASLEGALQR